VTAASPVRVGLISDTHGLLRPAVADLFTEVEMIVHGGDVGGMAVLDGLEQIARVVAVCGNVDDRHNPRLAAARTIRVGGLTLRVSHGHELGSPNPARLADAYAADGSVDILMFGHTHRSVVTTERRANRDLLVVNPGAAGPRRFNLPATIGILTIADGRPSVRIIAID